MTYVTPPATKKNALAATTTADITTGAVTIPISDCSICYDKDGNLITIGYVLRNPNSLTTPPPEEIIITDCSVAYGTGGPGNLTGVTRAVNYDANTGGIPQGAAYAWPTGTVIAVMISTKVYNTLIGDIADLEANKAATNQKLDDFGTPDDNTDLDATTSHHGLVVKPVAPASGLINVVAIGNGETAFTNKPLLDSTNPEALGASAAPGSAVVAARRDHVHPKPSAGDIGAATTSNKIDDFAVPGTSDTTKDANTTNHGLLLKAVAPATGFIRFVGIAYGETIYALKELFAATTPSMDGSASAGAALTAARIDHVHPSDTSRIGGSSGSTDGAIILADGTGGATVKTSSKTIVTTLGSDDTTVPTSKAVLKEFLKTYPIGVEWNYGSSLSAVSHIDRTGATVTLVTSDFTNHAVWGGMKRCNLSDAGVVNAWFGDTGFSYTGSNGQVMVWVPKFWYKAEKDIATTKIRWWISGVPLTGYKVHPAFITNGKEMAGFFISAFEGCAYDTSGAAYNTTDAAGVDFTVSTGDKLSSISGAKPISGKNNATATLPNLRIIAQNRGTGWQLQNFNQVSAIELLYLIEYASFYSQSVLSNGVTDITDDGSTNMAVNSGFTAGVGTGASDLGNASGEVAITHYQTSQTTHPFSYRGIENLYGNIWKWIDGINIEGNNNPWIADNGFISDQFSAPYVDTGLTLLASNNYVSQVAFNARLDYGFLAATGSGSSSTYLTDYYYQTTGNMAALFGGGWAFGAIAGAFLWNLSVAASLVYQGVGARLAFFV